MQLTAKLKQTGLLNIAVGEVCLLISVTAAVAVPVGVMAVVTVAISVTMSVIAMAVVVSIVTVPVVTMAIRPIGRTAMPISAAITMTGSMSICTVTG